MMVADIEYSSPMSTSYAAMPAPLERGPMVASRATASRNTPVPQA